MNKNNHTFCYRFNYDKKKHSQACKGDKITQPNMSYSIQQMVEASNRGLTVRIDPRLRYLDDEDDTLIEVKDLTDIDVLKTNYEHVNEFVEKKEKELKTKHLREEVAAEEKLKEATRIETTEAAATKSQ